MWLLVPPCAADVDEAAEEVRAVGDLGMPLNTDEPRAGAVLEGLDGAVVSPSGSGEIVGQPLHGLMVVGRDADAGGTQPAADPAVRGELDVVPSVLTHGGAVRLVADGV